VRHNCYIQREGLGRAPVCYRRCGTINPRVVPPGRNGPPKAPLALRVSATRQGVTGTKLSAAVEGRRYGLRRIHGDHGMPQCRNTPRPIRQTWTGRRVAVSVTMVPLFEAG